VEVIVVANGCNDRTVDVARHRCHRLVELSQKGLCVARNLGARLARGSLLVFLDADTLLERGTLRMIAETFSSRDAAGTVRGQPDSDRLAYRALYFLKNFTHRWHIHDGSSGVIICWKNHFVRLGGFNEEMEMRENSELIQRLQLFGRYRYLGATTAVTSMRRYDRRGLGRMVWLWFRLWVQSFFSDVRRRKYEIVR